MRKFCILLLIWLAVLPAQPVSAQAYAAERFDVVIDVQPDGSLLVTETVAFRFKGGPFTYAFRELDLEQLDRLEILSAGMDGEELPPGTAGGQVEINTRGDPYEVTWHFEPTTGQVRTFTLQYRVEGNMRIADGRDVLYWQAIPEEHEYEIERSSIVIRFPPELELDGAPRLEGASAEAQIEPGLVRWQVTGIQDDQALSVRAVFPSGTFLERPPEWQTAAIRRGELFRAALPYGIGLVIIAAALTAAWVTRQRRLIAERRPPSYPLGEVSAPPDELSPAQAGYLVSGMNTHMGDASAALLWLAEMGAIRLHEESRRGFLAKTDYRIELVDPNLPLKPHEAETLELIFPDRKQPEKLVYLSSVSTQLASRWSSISKRLRAELDALGLFDAEEARRILRVQLAATFLLLGAVGAGILGGVFIFASTAPLAFAGTLLVAAALGLLILAIGALVITFGWVPTTPSGENRRRRWQAFRDHLKTAARSDQWYDPELLNRYLPYAVAFDLGQEWARKLSRQGLEAALPWLVGNAGESGDISGLVAAIVVISSAGNGGAAGAGGGGGGASGAG